MDQALRAEAKEDRPLRTLTMIVLADNRPGQVKNGPRGSWTSSSSPGNLVTRRLQITQSDISRVEQQVQYLYRSQWDLRAQHVAPK